jgi:hypothetical protein
MENLMEDGTISRVCTAYSIRHGRRLPPTLEVKELPFVIVIVIVIVTVMRRMK